MALGRPREGLGGLKLDEIEAANSFPMLPMARRYLKWPVMSRGRPSASKGPQGWPQGSKKKSKKSGKIENFGTDLGWFGGDFGMVWG